jgi:branched-chain amino acid transport system substrate-binding protein
MISPNIYCFNPFCLKINDLPTSDPKTKICKHCKQNSLRLGNNIYVVELLKVNKQENESVNRISLVARNNTDETNRYYVKIAYKKASSVIEKLNQNIHDPDYKDPPPFLVPIDSASELNPSLRKIREATPYPEHIPIIEGAFKNEFCMCVVSRHVNGETLYEKIANNSRSSEYILELFEKIAKALKKMHDRGFIHGDIKPSNIRFSGNDNVFFIDSIATKDFDGYDYFPREETAYIPPELLDHVNKKLSYNYLQSYGIHHDLYAISAVFVKVLSNTFHSDFYLRDRNGKWDWSTDINGIDKIRIELDRLVAWEAGFRSTQSVDILIRCIEESSQPIISPLNTDLPTTVSPSRYWDNYIKFITAIPGLSWLGNYYNQLNDLEKRSILYKSMIIVVPFVFSSGTIWTAINYVIPPIQRTFFPPSQDNDQPENPRISQGEKILIKEEIQDLQPSQLKEQGSKCKQEGQDLQPSQLKEQGRKYFEDKKYTLASLSFEKILSCQKYKNAPETRIYFNNAKISNEQAYSIAVIVQSNEKSQDSLKILRGVAQAQDEFNTQQNTKKKNSEDSKPLKIVIVNDDDSEVTAKQVARNIVDRKEILGVIGHYSSNSTIAAGKVYNEGKLVAISATSTSDEITDVNPYVFRTVHKDSDAATILADYTIRQNKWNKVAVIYDSDNRYSTSLKSAFVEKINSYRSTKSVDTINIHRNINYLNELEKLKSEKTQALMLALPSTKLSYLFSIAKNKGEMNLLGGNELYTIDLLKNMQKSDREKKSIDNPNNMVLAVPWTIDNNKTTEFVKDSQKLWGGDVDWQTAMAYDAAQALIQAIKENPKATRETIKEALSSSKFIVTNGTTQKFKFDGRDRKNIVRLVQIKKSKENRSGTGYDFVEIP